MGRFPRQDSTTDQLASVREALQENPEAVEWLDSWKEDYRRTLTRATYVLLMTTARDLMCYDAQDAIQTRAGLHHFSVGGSRVID